MIKGIETGCLLEKDSFGRETGFVELETGLAQKTNEVAAGIKQILEA